MELAQLHTGIKFGIIILQLAIILFGIGFYETNILFSPGGYNDIEATRIVSYICSTLCFIVTCYGIFHSFSNLKIILPLIFSLIFAVTPIIVDHFIKVKKARESHTSMDLKNSELLNTIENQERLLQNKIQNNTTYSFEEATELILLVGDANLSYRSWGEDYSLLARKILLDSIKSGRFNIGAKGTIIYGKNNEKQTHYNNLFAYYSEINNLDLKFEKFLMKEKDMREVEIILKAFTTAPNYKIYKDHDQNTIGHYLQIIIDNNSELK